MKWVLGFLAEVVLTFRQPLVAEVYACARRYVVGQVASSNINGLHVDMAFAAMLAAWAIGSILKTVPDVVLQYLGLSRRSMLCRQPLVAEAGGRPTIPVVPLGALLAGGCFAFPKIGYAVTGTW